MMKGFVLGVVVGAVGMGFYTGHLQLLMDGKPIVPEPGPTDPMDPEQPDPPAAA